MNFHFFVLFFISLGASPGAWATVNRCDPGELVVHQKTTPGTPLSGITITRGSQTLHITPHALSQMHRVDDFVRSFGTTSMELGGVGLVRTEGGKTEIVDFISPDPHKIISFKVRTADQYSGGLIDLLIHNIAKCRLKI